MSFGVPRGSSQKDEKELHVQKRAFSTSYTVMSNQLSNDLDTELQLYPEIAPLRSPLTEW